MNILNKGKSPFYPGQPVPAELFVGRQKEVDRLRRAATQVALGKPQAFFIEGEYGIGKSSLAQYARLLMEKESRLLGLHVFLGGARTVDDIAEKTVQAALESRMMPGATFERIRNFLADYVGEQTLLGVTLRLDKLRLDSPSISRGFLPFLREIFARSTDDGCRGVLLIIDEINGVAETPDFAHFVKTLIDSNATSGAPLPLFLILTGVETKRKAMIDHHKPVERLFEVLTVSPMDERESTEFFDHAFRSVGITVDHDAMNILWRYSSGLPKLMHLVGEQAFWILEGDSLGRDDALKAVIEASREVGRRFVDQQVFRTLHSKDYKGILQKLCGIRFGLTFRKAELDALLTPTERAKLNSFLQKMKRLHVLRSHQRGEWTFSEWLTRIYIDMMSPTLLDKR